MKSSKIRNLRMISLPIIIMDIIIKNNISEKLDFIQVN